MDAQLYVLSGGTAGATVLLPRETCTLGRHPKSDVRFDSETDLAVSAVHAVITREGDHWFIQDLGSTNGTFVRGQRITAATVLVSGDRIELGLDGPALEFRVVSGGDTFLESASTRLTPTQVRAADLTTPAGDTPTGERVRVAVVRQTRKLRVVAAVSALLLLAAVSLLVVSSQRNQSVWDRERTEMRQRIDSLLVAGDAAVHSLEGQLSALSSALEESQQLVRRTRSDLARARSRGDTVQVQQLERELTAATTTLSRQSSAAQLDFRSIQQQNRRAIALVFVESADGAISTATAFAIRADATMLTNRHVVLGADLNRAPRRIAVQFSDSDQVWPARLIAVSRSADLAVIKVDNIAGAVPVIHGINQRPDTLAEGSPVALIGYPNGGEAAMSSGSGSALARPVLGSGVIQATAPTRLDIEGFGAAGASGSPVFDSNGEVVGVLFGGQPNATRQMVFAVPSPIALRLMDSLP